jgi:peroxin-10
MSYCEPDKYTVVRSELIDERYITKLNGDISEVLAAVTSNQTSRKFSRLISDACYYAFTILSRRQTIGQEVFNLVLYGHDVQNVPSSFAIFRYMALKTAMGFFSRLKLDKLGLKLTQWLLILCSKLVFVAFLTNLTSHYSLEHFISRISYHQLFREHLTNLGAKTKLLGYFKILEIGLYVLLVAKVLRQKLTQRKLKEDVATRSEQQQQQQLVSVSSPRIASLKCFICIESVCVPTAANCGHIYCWKCINSLFNSRKRNDENAKCPICRAEIFQNQIVWLNY